MIWPCAVPCPDSPFICGRAPHPRRLSGVDSLRRFVLCTFRPHGRLEGGRGSHRVPSLGFLLQGLSVAPPLYPKSTPTGFLPAAAVLRVLVALPFSGPLGPGVIMNSSCGWSQGSFAFPWGSFNFAHTPADNFSVTFSFVTLFRITPSLFCWDSGWFRPSFYFPVSFPTNLLRGMHWPHIPQIPCRSQILACPSGWEVSLPFSM